MPIDYRGRSISKWGEYLELRRGELSEFRELCAKVAAKLAAAGETAEAKLLFSMKICGIDNTGLVIFELVPMASAIEVCSAVKMLAALSATEPLQLGSDGHEVAITEATRSFKAPAGEPATPPASPPPATVKKASVNARMIDAIQKIPESTGWTVSQWESHLGCSRGAIAKARAWQSLKVVKRARDSRSLRALSSWLVGGRTL